MYAYIRGKLTHKQPTQVVLEIHGLGYLLNVSLSTSAALEEGKEYQLSTYLHVKEDQHTLFGFSKPTEKRLFLLLIGVSGIGPNTALMILSSLSVSDIRRAILEEDTRTIQSVKGIGAKTAQRVVLELRDKLQKETWEDSLETATPVGQLDRQTREEALQALVTLGLTRPVAERSIRAVLSKHGSDLSLEEIIKFSLKGL
ncbi:MAG: Holliday junction branch migration protein RuvA [Bernardetiaceae bacterium]